MGWGMVVVVFVVVVYRKTRAVQKCTVFGDAPCLKLSVDGYTELCVSTAIAPVLPLCGVGGFVMLVAVLAPRAAWLCGGWLWLYRCVWLF
ncbi:hypothetical protein, partial [uncultured Cardiobacterium sp.]|uniref:hypothetical protein n=1 Tax=uncultured Cardiobacterium sp. TaxID=417619 RepID=UPI002601EFAB